MAQQEFGKTAGGIPITDELVERLAKKAEAGYDVDETVRRRGGRPPIGSAPAAVESVRLDPELRAALRVRAEEDSETTSAVIRASLWRYLASRAEHESGAGSAPALQHRPALSLEDLPRVALELLGAPFLAYVLSTSQEVIAELEEGSATLDAEIEQALRDVTAHAVELASAHPLGEPEAYPDGSLLVRMRRFGWTDVDRGQTHANLFRLATGGRLPEVPRGLDPAEKAVAEAAIDHYPSTLLRLDEGTAFLPPKPLVSRARVLALEAALMADPISALMGDGTAFYTSSGMGYGAPNAYRIAECSLATAEQRVRMLCDREAPTFISEAVENLRRMRRLVATGTCSVPVAVGFWNVEIPSGTELAGPRGGRLRSGRESDPHVPMAARATLVLDTTCEVGLSIGETPPPAGDRFWAGVDALTAEEKFVSLAGLLAGPSNDEGLSMPVLAWTHIFDPFQPYVGRFVSAPSGPPTPAFSASRLGELEEWIERLDAGYHPSIRVAVSRTLSAVTERGPSDDALIDYVIALENLFGRPGPKLELRISSALARLLGRTRKERSEIAQRSRLVYRARSQLVHGEELSEADEHPQDQAQHLVLQALRALFTTHSHLIADRDARRELGERRLDAQTD
jgi:hypothetical protein